MDELLRLVAPIAWMLFGAFGFWFAQRIVRMATDDPFTHAPLVVPFEACGLDANAHGAPGLEIENDHVDDEELPTARVQVPNVTRRVRGLR